MYYKGLWTMSVHKGISKPNKYPDYCNGCIYIRSPVLKNESIICHVFVVNIETSDYGCVYITVPSKIPECPCTKCLIKMSCTKLCEARKRLSEEKGYPL